MKKKETASKIIGSEAKQYVILSLVLYAFWLVLSGLFKTKFLVIGLITALVTAHLTRPLLRLPSTARPGECFVALDIPYLKLFAYVPWLLWEIAKANIDVVKLVLDPKMPIDPEVVRFKMPMENPLAHVILANSITLTPGTVTMDLEDGVYYIHAITDNAAASLLPPHQEGSMPRRVAHIFGEREDAGEGGERL